MLAGQATLMGTWCSASRVIFASSRTTDVGLDMPVGQAALVGTWCSDFRPGVAKDINKDSDLFCDEVEWSGAVQCGVEGTEVCIRCCAVSSVVCIGRGEVSSALDVVHWMWCLGRGGWRWWSGGVCIEVSLGCGVVKTHRREPGVTHIPFSRGRGGRGFHSWWGQCPLLNARSMTAKCAEHRTLPFYGVVVSEVCSTCMTSELCVSR